MPPKSWEVSRQQPDAPQMSASPMQALEPNPIYEPSVLAKYGYGIGGGFIGFTTIAVRNYLLKRPFYANIYLYPLSIATGAAAVYALQKYRENQWAERDAIFRHYISLHPEDFPPYKREKIGDVFGNWTPIR